MMLPPPYTYVAGRLAEERSKDLMREGEHTRLVRLARPARFGTFDRLLARVGNLLVSSGRRLQARCPVVRMQLRERTIAPGPVTRTT